MKVIDIFKLPKSCIQSIEITKKELNNSGNLLNDDYDIIDYYIGKMKIEGIIGGNKINIPSYKNENIDYPFIYIITVGIKFREKVKKAADFIQRVIPNHSILILKYENLIMFNCALKEVKEDKIGIIIKDAIYSPWIDIENTNIEEQKFLNSIDIKEQSFDNLYKTYMDFYTKVNHSKLINIIEFYPDYVFIEEHNFNSEIFEIEEISSTIDSLLRDKEKEYSHQRKMEYFIKIKTYEKRIEELLEIIRGKK